MDYTKYFKGKKVTVMGLGLLGRGLGDAIFLAECGANLIVTDLRDEKTLAPSLAKLKKYNPVKAQGAHGAGNIRYTLGRHKFEDFRNCPKPSGDGRGPDFILKAAGVPLDSPYIAEARKYGVPIEMDASLFAKLMPKGVTLVGVTGTRGKSTTTALIYEILSRGSTSIGKEVEPQVYKGGNLVSEATLPFLEKVKSGDLVVLELDSWQLQGFHDAKISPQVAVFTTFLDDHLTYYKGDPKAPTALGHARERYFEDKVAIFKYQKKGDVLIAGEKVAKLISSRFDLESGKRPSLNGRTIRVARASDIPADWKIKVLGEHNRENIAAAIAAARVLGVSDAVIKKSVESFKGIPGRLEYLRTVKGVKIYNDNNATTPDATIAALRALALAVKTPDVGGFHTSGVKSVGRRTVLIMGGTDKGLDMSKLVAEIPKHCKAVVMLKETGTEKLLSEFPHLNSSFPKACPPIGRRGGARRAEDFLISQNETLKECVQKAMELAERGDTVLFSPAFASFGRWFRNEYDRGSQFVELIQKL